MSTFGICLPVRYIANIMQTMAIGLPIRGKSILSGDQFYRCEKGHIIATIFINILLYIMGVMIRRIISFISNIFHLFNALAVSKLIERGCKFFCVYGGKNLPVKFRYVHYSVELWD